MTTERQIEANRRNASASTGPNTEEGKARSRANALKHGLSGAGVVIAEGKAEVFEQRREKWGPSYSINDPTSAWAFDRLITASFRIEECEQALDGVLKGQADRAKLAWDAERRVDAAALASRLASYPSRIARQLEVTLRGSELMVELWSRLGEALDANGAWTEAETSTALDLLALPAGLRAGRTRLDGPKDADPAVHRRAVVVAEIDRLRSFQETALEPLDLIQRRQAESDSSGLSSKAAALILRYERDAWRRYREADCDLRATKVTPVEAAAPRIIPPPARPQVVPPEPRVIRERADQPSRNEPIGPRVNLDPLPRMDNYVDIAITGPRPPARPAPAAATLA